MRTPTTATMKAVRIHAYGPPGVLRYEDALRQEPVGAEVIVRVRAASVNAAFPLTLGLDFSDTIEFVAAPAAGGHAAGDEVYGRVDPLHLGTYAEYVVVRPGELTAKPRSVDHVHAAALPLVALTARQAIIAGVHGAPSIGLTAGQRILIHGAAGGVGSVAVQLAKWRGARVIATARGEDAAFVRGLGADEVIDYTRQRFEDVVGPVDAVLDLVGGDTQARSWNVLREGGALASTWVSRRTRRRPRTA